MTDSLRSSPVGSSLIAAKTKRSRLYPWIARTFAGDDARKSRVIRLLHRRSRDFRRWWGVL